MADDNLGSREDNEKKSYKLITDNAEQKVAQRVDDPVTHSKLDDVVTALGGTIGATETLQFSGTVGTSPISLPSVAGGALVTVMVSCKVQTPSSRRLQFSLDGGTTFFTLTPGSMVGWEPKAITQIQIKGNVAGVEYDVIINR